MAWKLFWEITVGMGCGIFAYIYLTVLIKGVPEVLQTVRPDKPDKE